MNRRSFLKRGTKMLAGVAVGAQIADALPERKWKFRMMHHAPIGSQAVITLASQPLTGYECVMRVMAEEYVIIRNQMAADFERQASLFKA